ncbi:hypothetical protein L484_015065 [Morus notabilis]|uniref:Uncharacterized protein n=1 Tax=Morus notabilis TaxID=981085 RepID=W9S772_9ROSA|nr:hypothetical protein L484_015065 [Morus notabilis]
MADLNHASIEDHEIPNGWPLGLEVMNTRLRVFDSLPVATVQHYTLHAPSASVSSLLSSDLDTESTASFFQDHSVSLGRLIGIKPGDGGRLYFPDSIHFNEHGRISRTGSQSDVSRRDGVYMCRGICIPLLVCALMKTSRNKSKPRSVKAAHLGRRAKDFRLNWASLKILSSLELRPSLTRNVIGS